MLNFNKDETAQLEGVLAVLKYSAKSVPPATKRKLIFEHIEIEELTRDHCIGFVTIKDLGDGVQCKFSAKMLSRAFKIVDAMEKTGYEVVWVTLAENEPIIFGGKKCGVAISPRIETDI